MAFQPKIIATRSTGQPGMVNTFRRQVGGRIVVPGRRAPAIPRGGGLRRPLPMAGVRRPGRR